MLRFDLLAKWARLRASARIQNNSKNKGDNSRMYAAVNQLFYERVLDACRRIADTPAAVPDIGFVALPERLLAKVAYLSTGPTRSAKELIERPEGISDASVDLLSHYTRVGDDCHFLHLTSQPGWEQLKRVLMCHGLSPVGDSILLLADIGRSARLGFALNLPLHVMLADISWMSSNRSIRQFVTLDEETIDTGLRVCLDKRRRLYESLGATYDVREIAPYSRQGSINREKLMHISQRYHELGKTLWGVAGQLENEEIKFICASLDQTMFTKVGSLPEHMRVIAQFPRTLTVLENELKPHLEIIRIVARQFNTLDEEVFTYFFAQYYAQYPYRGSSLKVGVESEKKFDERFDTLDPYFQTWGEGHSTTEMLLGHKPKQNSPLAAAYLPQYQIGNLRLLPYTPLSLNALQVPGKDHRIVISKMIAIDKRNAQEEELGEILLHTPVAQRNRLIGDILSFVMLARRRWSMQLINEECRQLGIENFEALLKTWSPILAASWQQELELSDSSAVNDMWTTWLKSCEVEPNPTYIPVHIFVLLMDESDWDGTAFASAIQVIRLACSLYQQII